MTDTRWEQFKASLWYDRDLEMMLDTSRTLSTDAMANLQPSLAKAIAALITATVHHHNGKLGRRIGRRTRATLLDRHRLK